MSLCVAADRKLTHPTSKLPVKQASALETFAWDAASNPKDSTDRYGEHVQVQNSNRVTVWQDQRFEYDQHGNLTYKIQGKRASPAQVETRLFWDEAHQLSQAVVTRGAGTSATTQVYWYGYDALGRRVTKTDTFGTTTFAWDDNQMVLEQRGGKETQTIYQPDSFVPLAQIHDGKLHHLHTDHLGTPLEASNDAGQIVWKVTYKTWGNVVLEEFSEEVRQDTAPKLRFQGQYFDAETGLHYNRFRYYDPGVGRFVNQDPIGLEGGINTRRHKGSVAAYQKHKGVKYR